MCLLAPSHFCFFEPDEKLKSRGEAVTTFGAKKFKKVVPASYQHKDSTAVFTIGQFGPWRLCLGVEQELADETNL